MKRTAVFIGLLGMFSVLSLGPAGAVEVTGEPGSPSATTTIDGKQLPPPPDKHFGGKIERSVLDSTPYWPPRVVPVSYTHLTLPTMRLRCSSRWAAGH